MTDIDDGLPLPPPPPYRLPGPPSKAGPVPPDLPDVNRRLDDFTSNVPTNAPYPVRPPIAPARGTRPAQFDKVKSPLEELFEAVEGGHPLDAALSWLGQLSVSATVQRYYSSVIAAWQQQFLDRHRQQLNIMNKLADQERLTLAALEELLRKQRPRHNPRTEEILSEKQKLGDDFVKDVGERLKSTPPGPERDQLEKVYRDAQAWIRQRDARVEAERPRVNALERAQERLDALARTLADEIGMASNETLKMVSPANPLVHASAGAGDYFDELHDYLLGTRQRLDEVLRP